jgi:HPt (histidine-containing phosphotransfer) domain-containing protein
MNESRDERRAAARVRMTELAAKFIGRTRGELGTMRDALTRLAAGDVAALGELHHLAHRISGTGATLGFEMLSDSAARIEKLVEGQAPGGVPEEFALAQITGAIESLDHELAQLAAAKPV